MFEDNGKPRRYRYEIAAAISLTAIAIVLLAASAIGGEGTKTAAGGPETFVPASSN